MMNDMGVFLTMNKYIKREEWKALMDKQFQLLQSYFMLYFDLKTLEKYYEEVLRGNKHKHSFGLPGCKQANSLATLCKPPINKEQWQLYEKVWKW